MTAEEALHQVRQRHGLRFTFEGRCSGGEVGAFFARAADGQRFVFKWSDNPLALTYFADVVARVERLRSRGYPAPRYLNPLAVDGGVVVFQEAVTGSWHDEVDNRFVDLILELNDRQADDLDDHGHWTQYMHKTLTEGADGYCIHATMEDHSGTTRRLLSWIEGIGRELSEIPGRDVVHEDFHHRNMLRDGQRLIAVIDWEGCHAGDRVFDLVTFCFGMTHAHAEPGVEDRVWSRAVELADPNALRAYVAHMTLRRVDWTIRHHSEELAQLMPLVERYVELVA